jgi:hypothetical protein
MAPQKKTNERTKLISENMSRNTKAHRDFFIENTQDYIESTEVTALPPLFDYWNRNWVLGSLLI